MTALLVVTPPGPDCDALCATLRERGYTVHTAESGAVAIEVALRRLPDVILMDPALSAMDRWHAVKRLNTERSTSTIPVLTLASDVSSPAGLQRVLGKIEQSLDRSPRRRAPRTLQEEASRAVPPVRRARTEPPFPRAAAPPLPSLPPATRSAPAPVSPPPAMGPSPADAQTPAPPRVRVADRASGGRLLVVDDNALNRDMLSRRLTRRGYEVEVAEDGQQALDLIAARPFDLVLLDWMMPGLSGLDVLKRVREDHSPIELPIIMATARTEADDIVEALKHEANDYVTKPLNFDVVNARIKTQLGLVQAHRQLAASERRYRALLENTGDMILQYTVDGTLTYVSPASRTLLGFEPEALKARPLFEWLHPIDRRALEAQQRARPTLPPAFTYIARMQRQDAAWIWVEVSCRLVREGTEPVILAACRDVTEHMERLGGDEPPLPLGGDIMAHPGWRGGGGEAAPKPASDAGAGSPRVVVLTVLGDQVDMVLEEGSTEAVTRAIARRLTDVWGEG